MSREKKVKKPKGKLGKLEKREARAGYLFVLPWVIGVLLFMLYPLCQSFYYMWFNIRITPLGTKFTYVGTGNFTQIWMENPEFPQQIVTYLWQTIVEVPIIVIFALMIAIMLNGNIRCKGFFRLIFFLPVIIVSGPVMNMLVGEGAATIPAMNVQSIVAALESFLPAGLASSIGEIFSNMIMILWYSGVQILIFLSALQKIDSALYEAAKIDGANRWQTLWKVTIPNVMPSITICTFLTLTNSFKLFDQNLALTGGQPYIIQSDGSAIKTTEMLALNIYNTFYGQNVNSRGTAQAKAVLFFLLVAAIGLIQLRATRKKEVQQ